jgi:outer membrane protein insertion porin family
VALPLRLPLAAVLLGAVLVLAAGCGRPFTLGTDEEDPVTFADADLHFDGNRHLWDYTLANAISDFGVRAVTSGSADDAAWSLTRYYQERGFPYAEVRSRLRERDDGTPVVHFDVYEGPRPPVTSIHFAGNREVSDERLRKSVGLFEHRWYAPSWLNEARLDEDVDRLENVYRTRGYLDAHVQPLVTFRGVHPEAHILWRVSEGAHYTVAAITVTGNTILPARDIIAAAGVTLGADFYDRRLVEVREAVERLYQDGGHAFAKADASADIDRAAARVTIKINVDEGLPWRFGNIFVRGNVRTKTYIITREFDLSKGDPYAAKKVRDAERKLYELGLFDRISIERTPSEEGDRFADLTVNVRERQAGTVRVGGGWGSYDGPRVQLGASYLNLFGRGIQADGRILASLRGYQANVGLRDPFVLGTPLRFDLDLYYEDRDVRVFDIERRGGTAFLSYPAFPELIGGLRVSAGVRIENSIVTDTTGTAVAEDTLNLVSTIARIALDRRDDPIEPTYGSYHEISYEEAGVLELGEAEFSKLTATAAYFFTPIERLTIATAIRGGIIYDHHGHPIPIQERFFLGGDTSLRGFEQNEVGDPDGGSIFVLGSIEPRFTIVGPLAVAVFVDAGNVFQHYATVRLEDLRVTPGAGLRLKTPIGPLRLDVGVKADRRSGEDWGEVHFAVGQPF